MLFFIDPPVIRVVFSLIGKFFISIVLAIAYSFTAELFPTEIRSSMIGLCSTSGRIGGILAPILADVVRLVLFFS
jgi:OCT family organic cation transporter-like MFS transporter 4/5